MRESDEDKDQRKAVYFDRCVSRTKDDVRELALKGKVILADNAEYDIHELLAKVEPEFFGLYIADNLDAYYQHITGSNFMIDMMRSASEKCADEILSINYGVFK